MWICANEVVLSSGMGEKKYFDMVWSSWENEKWSLWQKCMWVKLKDCKRERPDVRWKYRLKEYMHERYWFNK